MSRIEETFDAQQEVQWIRSRRVMRRPGGMAPGEPPAEDPPQLHRPLSPEDAGAEDAGNRKRPHPRGSLTMPSFRSDKSQAEHAISQKLALGKGRHDHKNDGRIRSLGTARGYGISLKVLAGYLKEHRLGVLRTLTIEIAQKYLEERATTASQKSLDLDRPERRPEGA